MANLRPSMWKITPTCHGHFQWSVTSGDAWLQSSEPSKTLANDDPRSRLSSMNDLLLQANQISCGDSRLELAEPFKTLAAEAVDDPRSRFSSMNDLLQADQSNLGSTIAATCVDHWPSKIVAEEAGDDHRSRFSSMNDLLLQADQSNLGSSKHCFLDQHVSDPKSGGVEGGTAMFSTGSGKRVSIQQSSVQKAKSLLEGTNAIDNASCGDARLGSSEHSPKTPASEADIDPRSRLSSTKDLIQADQSNLATSKLCFPNQHVSALKPGGVQGGSAMFSIGSGKTVSVRPSSIQKGKSLLEGTNAADNGGCDRECFPMFRTGLGKAVQVRESSMKKAAALLEGANDKQDQLMDQVDLLKHTQNDKGILMNAGLRIGKDVNPVTTFQSIPHIDSREFCLPEIPVCNNALVDHNTHEEHDNESTYLPLKFHTAGGRAISISTVALKHARTLLDDFGSEAFDSEVNANDKGILMNAKSGKTIDGNCVATFQSKPHFESREFNLPGIPVCNKALVDHSIPEEQDNRSTYPPLKFQTAGGRSISISTVALKHARTLLDDFGSEAFDGEVNANDKGILMNTGLRTGKTIDGNGVATFQSNPHFDSREFGLPEIPVCHKALVDHSIPEEHDNISIYPPLKFQTAGGRSMSISTDALKHATTLLDDLGSEACYGEVNAVLARYTCENEKISNKACNNIKSVSIDSSHKERFMNRNVLEIPSPAKQLYRPLIKPITSSALSTLVDSKHDRISSNNGSWTNPSNEDLPIEHKTVPLVENHLNGEKRIPGKGRSSSSFKRPRILRSSRLAETKAALPSTSVNCCGRARVSLRYPFQLQRKKLKDYFGGPPRRFSMLENVPDGVRYMTADSAENYRFHDTCSNIDLGPEEFREMLLQSGASQGETSEKWVENHYKWIVWKLACLERCYPSKTISRFLTVSNVLEELKYRYEREVNYGHRSALKKVLDGDISPSSMMILCVSAIRSSGRTNEMCSSSTLHEDGNKLIEFDLNYAVKIELTDGWYSVDATLDMHLSKQLIAGKLFVGQKLRVCGATLCGWDEPVSPLEAPMVSFVLHINGTYRAHWSDSLGLYKGVGTPLAFRCIKGGGGRVPITLVGISRLYPILYKERLFDGGSIVRSESLEKKVLQLYSQRRSDIAEDIISELEDAPIHVTDSGEGAKILRILEGSSEPEVLMAGMSSEQLISFSTYQAKQEALRQDNLHKKIERALEEAGLGSRDVTPFMRVKVMGLISVGSSRRGQPKEGLITIWNPTEKQKLDLLEGQIYSVSYLTPLKGTSDFLHLQARGASSEWNRFPSTYSMNFKPFFIPRKSVPLSDLGEVPLASEFDISAVVVHVGKVYVSGCQKKQWIFVTDGSGGICSSSTEDQHDDCLLAVSFRSPIFGNDSLEPVNRRLAGSTVGFCNLIKRARDRNNHLWVAEATETCTYSVFCNISCGSHLKEAADSALKWANSSSSVLQKLEERVLCITGDRGI